VPNLVEWDPLRAEAGYRQVVEQSLLACDEPGALVIWPESAAWPRSVGDARLDSDIARILARGCSLLVNSATHEEGRWYNSVWLFTPGRQPQRADKRHLVPFGEYVPLGELIPFVGRLARNAGDFSPASEVRLLDLGGERLGVAICFEVVFPAETAELVQAGATMLVTVTNDAWYGDTAAPWQHLASALFRAAETARPLLRAAITGVSAWVDPRGRVVEQLGVERRGTIRARVVGSTLASPAARWPWLGPLLALTVAAWALLAGRRSRRSLARDQEPPAA
jgi:apolipoprotein N-acyltransferase